MKRRMIWLVTFVFACVTLLTCLLPVAFAQEDGALRPVDVGNFTDYDSSGGGWDFDWDSGSDSDWGSSGSSSSGGFFFLPMLGGGGGSIVGVIIIAVILYFIFRNRRGSSGGQQRVVMPADHTGIILPAIRQVDPLFDPEKFLAWNKEVFVTLQNAWTARDWSKIRPFEKEELYRQHEQMLQEYISKKQINVVENINVNQAYLHKYERYTEYEYMTTYLQARMNDYIIDETTRQVVKGNPNQAIYPHYLLTFMRKNGVKTDPSSSGHSTTNCPNCGAPTAITSAGQCEYCGSVITTGDFDWVLSNIIAVRPGVNIDNSGVTIQDGSANGANMNGMNGANMAGMNMGMGQNSGAGFGQPGGSFNQNQSSAPGADAYTMPGMGGTGEADGNPPDDGMPPQQ